jgi:hypothetical protein
MSGSEQTAVDTSPEPSPPPGRPGWAKVARRYGPIALVVVLIGAAVLVFGRGGDGDDKASEDGGETSQEDLIVRAP